MQTNKQDYVDQMVNRESLERVHERMNDELVAWAMAAADPMDSEGQPGGTTPNVSINPRMEDFPDHWCRVSQDQSQKLYIPSFLNEPQNVSDPAFKVSTSMEGEHMFRC
jgi:hypothetical protein